MWVPEVKRWHLYAFAVGNAGFLIFNIFFSEQSLPWRLALALISGIVLGVLIVTLVQTGRVWRKLARTSVLRHLALCGDLTGSELREALEALHHVGPLYVFLASLEEEGVIEGFNGPEAPLGVRLRKYRITSKGIRERLASDLSHLSNRKPS